MQKASTDGVPKPDRNWVDRNWVNIQKLGPLRQRFIYEWWNISVICYLPSNYEARKNNCLLNKNVLQKQNTGSYSILNSCHVWQGYITCSHRLHVNNEQGTISAKLHFLNRNHAHMLVLLQQLLLVPNTKTHNIAILKTSN